MPARRRSRPLTGRHPWPARHDIRAARRCGLRYKDVQLPNREAGANGAAIMKCIGLPTASVVEMWPASNACQLRPARRCGEQRRSVVQRAILRSSHDQVDRCRPPREARIDVAFAIDHDYHRSRPGHCGEQCSASDDDNAGLSPIACFRATGKNRNRASPKTGFPCFGISR